MPDPGPPSLVLWALMGEREHLPQESAVFPSEGQQQLLKCYLLLLLLFPNPSLGMEAQKTLLVSEPEEPDLGPTWSPNSLSV